MNCIAACIRVNSFDSSWMDGRCLRGAKGRAARSWDFHLSWNTLFVAVPWLPLPHSVSWNSNASLRLRSSINGNIGRGISWCLIAPELPVEPFLVALLPSSLASFFLSCDHTLISLLQWRIILNAIPSFFLRNCFWLTSLDAIYSLNVSLDLCGKPEPPSSWCSGSTVTGNGLHLLFTWR